MSELARRLLSAFQAMDEGALISSKEFIHFGSRAVINKILCQFAHEGRLLRVSRGTYVLPVQGKFGARPPSSESVVKAMQTMCGELVVAGGAAEANALGLTTQVPTREVFFTSGVSRIIHLGNSCVEFKHAKGCQLLLGNRPSGKVIRVLLWLGPDASLDAVKQLRDQLPTSEWGALIEVLDKLPSWMAKVVCSVK